MLFEIPLVELLVRTWRLRGPELPAGPVVWCCWHGDLPAAFRLLRDVRPMALVSASRDGRRWTPLFERAGWKVANGSSGGRAAAARHLLRHLREGGSAGMALDGPRGPARVERPGTRWLAEKSGRPAVLLEFGYSRALTLRTWDSMRIPLPLAEIEYSWSYL